MIARTGIKIKINSPWSRSLICFSSTRDPGPASPPAAFAASAAAAFIARIRAYFFRSSSSSTIVTVPLPRSTLNFGRFASLGGRHTLPVRQSPVYSFRSTSGAGIVLTSGGRDVGMLLSSSFFSSAARTVSERTRRSGRAPRRGATPTRAVVARQALIICDKGSLGSIRGD